ncbi:MAG: radical SAM protein [Candidatus Bathyarchaeota archaeon]|jgi:DNA repair photolyase|nr:radical SAM protein [Candidatus Bathyarchaeota archaeon]
MIVKEVQAKSILNVSKVYTYVVNPYTGCQHGCSYCYARFTKRFSRHREPWGEFVDVKINAPDLLKLEISKKRRGRVWVSGVCDPYQPLEEKYKLTRRCLEILRQHNWPVIIQTRSPLVLRDMDIIKEAREFEVGLTVTTADDETRKLFEPNTPPIIDRIRTLDKFHRAGVRTYAMIAPILPGAETLPELLAGNVDYVLVDRMNYHYADWVYRKYGLEDKHSDEFFQRLGRDLASKLEKLNIPCHITF